MKQKCLLESSSEADEIRYIISRHVKAYAAHMYSAKAPSNEVYNLSAAKPWKIESKEKRFFSIIAGVLSLYLGHKVDKDKITVVTFNLLGMCHSIYSWYNPQGAINSEQLSQIIFENFTEGLPSFQRNRLQ